ncbi:MAG: ABC transporter permease subunit [Thermotogae bacterium]|nr:ABC transporter permease subunit [Thermotogota bacterium]
MLRTTLKVVGWFFLFVTNALAFWASTFLISYGLKSLGIVIASLIVIVDFIFFSRRAYPYRYIIPAVILLAILVVYPIYFTINIAFTNYGTGHIEVREEVVKRLITDPLYTYIPEEAHSVSYTVFVRYENLSPTDDFLIVFNVGGHHFVAGVAQPKVRRGREIVLREGVLVPVTSEHHDFQGHVLEVVPDDFFNLTDARMLKIGEEVYRRFYNPDDPFTVRNEMFFKSRIGQKYLANAEYITPDGVRLALKISSDGKWRFFPVKRLYVLSYREVEIDGERVFKSVVINTKTNRPLLEEEGAFYELTSEGKKKFVAGYIDYVGVRNFMRIFTDPSVSRPFLKIFAWNFTWAALSVLFTFIVGLSFALVLNDRTLKGRVLYRTLLIVPWAIPAFISVLVWRNGIFNESYGLLNKFLLSIFGIKLKWFSDAFLAKIACLAVNTWLGFPYMMTVSLGALQSIPDEFYEAAAMDGAGKVQRFFSITFPLLLTTVAPLLVGSFAFNFNNFVNIYLLTQGGPPMPNTTTPAGATDILISYTYKLAFEGGRGQDFGFASAVSVIIFVIVAGISFVNFKLSGSFEEVSR